MSSVASGRSFEVMRDLRTGTGFDEEISPFRPSERRDAEHEKIRRVPKRFRHKGEAAREAESISQTSGGLSCEKIARQLHRAAVIANRAAQDRRLGRLDSGQHIAPARRRGHGRRRAAKAANVDADHVVSSLRPFPLDVALRVRSRGCARRAGAARHPASRGCSR